MVSLANSVFTMFSHTNNSGRATSTERLKTGAEKSARLATRWARRVFRPIPLWTTIRAKNKIIPRSPTHQRTRNMSNSVEQTFDEFLTATDLRSLDRNYMKWYGSIVIKPV
jgi:hypothetical protein